MALNKFPFEKGFVCAAAFIALDPASWFANFTTTNVTSKGNKKTLSNCYFIFSYNSEIKHDFYS